MIERCLHPAGRASSATTAADLPQGTALFQPHRREARCPIDAGGGASTGPTTPAGRCFLRGGKSTQPLTPPPASLRGCEPSRAVVQQPHDVGRVEAPFRSFCPIG